MRISDWSSDVCSSDLGAPVKGRRADRNAADAAWCTLRGTFYNFRLPGIYGPGRSMLDRIRAGTAHRIDLPGQVFSRIHIDDIADGVIASFAGPPGTYNLADDEPLHRNWTTGDDDGSGDRKSTRLNSRHQC